MLQKDQVIYALSDQECNDDVIWHCCRELRQVLPRRKWPEKILEAIGNYEGAILHLDGSPFELSDDDTRNFGDVDYRWLDNCYLATDTCGKRLHPHTKNPERIRLIDLYFQIKFPMSVASAYR